VWGRMGQKLIDFNVDVLQKAGIITLKCDIIKGGVEKFALKQPIFVPGPVSR
jgi:hypothetical protein